MLGEHEKALRSLDEQQGSNNPRLNQAFELLQNMHERLYDSSPGTITASTPAPSSPSQAVLRDESFPTPDHFTGDVSKCGGFCRGKNCLLYGEEAKTTISLLRFKEFITD